MTYGEAHYLTPQSVRFEAVVVTIVKYLLKLFGKILSLAIEGFMLIVSLWFLIGIMGFGLLVMIALIYGLLSLR